MSYTDTNTIQDDIILSSKNRFSPSITEKELNTLDYLFCVDNLENTRCFARNKRPLCITKKYRQKFIWSFC